MIEYINYKGVEHPVKVSFSALMAVKRETGKNMLNGLELKDDEIFDVLEPLLFYGLKAGYEAENKTFDIEREKVVYMLDDNFQKFIEMLPKFFANITASTASTTLSDQNVAAERSRSEKKN